MRYRKALVQYQWKLDFYINLLQYRTLVTRFRDGLLAESDPEEFIIALVDLLYAAYRLKRLDRALQFMADIYSNATRYTNVILRTFASALVKATKRTVGADDSVGRNVVAQAFKLATVRGPQLTAELVSISIGIGYNKECFAIAAALSTAMA